MKKFLKSLVAIVLVVSIAFSMSFVQAEAFTVGTAVIAGGIILFLGSIVKEVVDEKNIREETITNTVPNISHDEWVYIKTNPGIAKSYYSITVNDGNVGDLIQVFVEKKSGTNWNTLAKVPYGVEDVDFILNDEKKVESYGKGNSKFRLEGWDEIYRIKIKKVMDDEFWGEKYSQITVTTYNANIIDNPNNSKTSSSALVGSFSDVFSKTIISSAVTYNSANYKNNPSQAYNTLETIKFGNVSIDSSSGTAAKLSSTIKNPSAVRMSNYGVVLKESSGNGTHSDEKGSTSAKSINYSGTIKGLKPVTSYTGMMFANTAYGAVCSPTFTFKTPLIKPPKAKISSAKVIDYRTNTETNSTDMGIGDNVSIKWNKADYADYYTISINGVEDTTKIKGTSKVLSFDDAGAKTIKVRAHNSVGSGEWSDAITVTVHPDVNITFYKDGNIYQQQTLTWNHDLETLPELPVKKGAAFKGWYNVDATSAVSFKNIKSDLETHAAYDINKYTVKFVGPDGTSLGEQIVEYGNSAVEPSQEDVNEVIKEGRTFIGWNKDFSCVIENMTVTAVSDAENQDVPVEITDASAVRYARNYVVTCNVNNLTRADVENGRIVVALKTEQGKLVTTTESAAYFLDANYNDVNGNLVTNSEYIKVVVPVLDEGKTLTASVAEIYAIKDYKSLVPISSKVDVTIVDADPWGEPTTEVRSGYEADEIESWTEYQSREFMITTTNSSTERDRLVSEEGWQYDETATTSYKDKNSGTWTTTKPSSGTVDVDYAQKTVTDKAATTVYKYRTYRYWNSAAGAYYYSYGRGYADSMGYSGKWYYKETSKALSKIGTVDGYYQYDYSDDNYIWYSNGTDKKTNPKVTTAAVTHIEYRVFDTIYTYYLNKWPDNFSAWTTTPITGTDTVEVKTRTVYRYKEDEIVRVEDNSGEQREDDFLFGLLGEEFAGKQVILAIYKINEASDWTLEHIDQTVINEDGTYEFSKYKLREDLSETTGDLTVVLGVEGAEEPIYIDTIEAPKPEYTVTYVDSTTGEKIPISSEEVENYKYYYKRYKYEYNGTTYYSYSQSYADSLGLTGTWMYTITTEPLEYTGSVGGVAVYEGWYRADSNKTEGTKYTTYKEYVGMSTVYTYEQTVVEHEDAIPPEAPVHEGYTFSHWDMRSSDITSNTVINAIYTPNKYNVVWIDYVQEKYEVETYQHGENLVPPYGLLETVEMIPDGWDSYVTGTVVPVTSNMVITAQYEYKTFTVDFLDFDGNVVDSQTVKYGETPEAPEFDYEGEENLIFFGFTSEEEQVETDEEQIETASAELTESVGTEEGSESEGEESDYIIVEDYQIYNNCQITPKFEFVNTTETPTIDVATGTYTTAQTVTIECATESASIFYTLDGSDPATSETAIESASPAVITIEDSCQLRYYASAFNMNVSAEGSEWYAINDGDETNKYIVKFAAYDDESVVYTAIAETGSLIDEALVPAVEGYTFDGAYTAVNVVTDEETGEITDITYSNEWDFETSTITADTTLYLKYDINSYNVEFVDYDGMIISNQSVAYGESALLPEAPTREGYVFTGWDTDEHVAVTEDITVNAVYVPEDEYVTIDLNRSSYTMMSGNSYTLTATTGGNVENPEIVWASSDENVAVVDDDGVVTATGKGSAEIYAIIVDNGETATCKINVVGNPSDELTLVGKSHLAVDDYGYIRGFTVSTNAETQEHYAETVAEVKSQFLNNELVFTDINGNILSDDDYVGTGTVIKAMNGDKVLDKITVVVSGDMDGDGYVTNRDASRISRYLVDKESPTEVQICAMDVNGDGYVNNRDASVVSRYLVGKETL